MLGDIIQPTHLLFILVVALLVLGPKRLPEVGRGLGQGIRDFRGALAGLEETAIGQPAVAPIHPAQPEPAVNVESATVEYAAALSEPHPSDYAG